MTWVSAIGLIWRTPTRVFDLSTPEGRRKASDYRYFRSERGREVNRRARRKYAASEKGKARVAGRRERRRETDRAFYARNPERREYINAKNREYRRKRKLEKENGNRTKALVSVGQVQDLRAPVGNQRILDHTPHLPRKQADRSPVISP